MGRRVATALAVTSLVAACSLPAAADATARKAKLSVRLQTDTQAQALRSGRLRVRLVARRAARVSVQARVGKKAATKRATVRLTRGKARTVSLKLTRAGRRLLGGCGAPRATVVVRDLRKRDSRVRRTESLTADASRCPRSDAKAQLPGCAKPDAPGGEWRFYSGTFDGHRNQLAEKSINTGNVSGLGVAWQRQPPDGGLIHSTPVVADGCVYFGTDLGNAYALNADTGKIVWQRALGEGGQGSNSFEGAGIVGSPSVAGGLVYVGATTPKGSVLSALDQATGTVVWRQVVDADKGGGLDSSSVPFKGLVFQAFKGDESSDHSNPGFVIVDGSRDGGGKILAKTHNIPAKDFAAGYRGGSIINTPPVDLQKMLVFAGTGNPASQKQHPITNSLLKIDANPASPTFGKILASHRGTSDSYPSPQDVDSPTCQSDVQWPLGRFSCMQLDYNFLASGNLWTNSAGRQLFGGLQKSGVYTAVYRDTMEEAWRATIGLPCFACNLSSTAVDEHGIYVAVTGGNLYSLNKDTGAVQWATPLTGTFRYNGVAVANGVVYSLNDAAGTLEAFDAASGAPLFAHPFMQDTQTFMQDMGNSSGVSVARNTVFATSQADGASTLFALKLGATGDGDDGGGEPPPGESPPPGGSPSSTGIVATGPGAPSYGYLTPVVVVSKGGTVSYTNLDTVRHNVKSADGLFRSELANTGETVTVAGTEKLEPGTYQFYCEPHPNMTGQLIVR
jgi:outer membrane protein assembly factor BamB/plastocyanin